MTRLRRTGFSFVLLEVMLALVILSVLLATLLRGFAVALGGIRSNKIIATASLLAESLLEDYELEQPTKGHKDGGFVEDPRFGEAFAYYFWDREVEEVRVDYKDFPRDPLQEPEPLYKLQLKIRYDDGKRKAFVPVEVTTYLLDSQLFSDDAMQANQLF